MPGGMPTTQRTVLHIFQTLQARAELDELVARMFPHDVYRQTVAVMGFDPLPPEPSTVPDE